jgi:acetyl-CoA decarbonylase/synthase complex subunit delta
VAYKKAAKKYSGEIREVTLGSGDKAVAIGGKNVLPIHSFDGNVGNPPKIGLEIVDIVPEDWHDDLKKIYDGVLEDTAEWAKFAVDNFAPDFICLRFAGADPDGKNKSVEECVETAKKVAAAVDLPLVIAGTKNVEKDEKLFSAVAEALAGENVLILSAREENYKTVGAAGALAYKHKIAAETSVDINLAKQLNILMNQLGVQNEDLVMNVGSAAVGYGFEYLSSTMDRIILAALGQNDSTLQMPIITPVSTETWTVKESAASEDDEPAWGSSIERAIQMEVATAAAVLVSGADAIIVRHPKSLATMKTFISNMLGSGLN